MSEQIPSPVIPDENQTTATGAQPAVESPVKERSHRIRERHDALTGWAFMAPFALAFALVFLIPIFVSFYKSFFKPVASGGGLFGGGELTPQFVGFQNYIDVVTNSNFWWGILRVVGYTFFQVPVMILMALALALVLDSFLTRHVTIYRLGYFLPFAIPGIVAAMIWLYLYTPDMSPILSLFQYLGLEIDLMEPNIILVSMANMTTWTYTGYNMLIFLAALQAIPGELSEAARIDGATGFQITMKIKVPLVRGAALLAVLLSIIGTIQLFNEPTVMATVNRWMGESYTPMMMAYNTMMGKLTPGGDGPASAVSIVMALIAGVLAVIYALADRRMSK